MTTTSPSERGASRRGRLDAALLPLLLEAIKQEARSPRDRPERLEDLLDLLQPLPGFLPLARALLDNTPDPARVQSALEPLLDALPPRGHHHLALLHLRWGFEALDPAPALATPPPPAQRARRAAERWTRAHHHLARSLASPDLFVELTHAAGAPDQAAALQARAPDLFLDPHGHALLAAFAPDAPAEPSRAEAHWAILLHPAPPLAPAAARWRQRLVEHAARTFTHLASPLDPLQSDLDALRQPLWYAQRFTHVAGMAEPLTVAVIEQVVAWGWTLYKTRTEDKLRELTHAARPFSNHLESLLLRNEGAFGRQALCADLLLFVADFAPRDEQERIFQRTLRICPGHRNSRLMLSYHHLQTANLHLNRLDAYDPIRAFTPGVQADLRQALQDAQDAIQRARDAFPENERLPDYDRRLRQAQEKLP